MDGWTQYFIAGVGGKIAYDFIDNLIASLGFSGAIKDAVVALAAKYGADRMAQPEIKSLLYGLGLISLGNATAKILGGSLFGTRQAGGGALSPYAAALSYAGGG